MSNGQTERNETYRAARLNISNIPGTVQVRVGHEAGMRVHITGPEKLVDRIRREVRGDVLDISGPHTGGAGGVTIVSAGGAQTSVFSDVVGGMVITSGRGVVINGGGGGVVINNGRVVSGGDVTYVDSEEVRIVVDVPHRTPVTIDEGTVGRYEIGDTEGPLDLRMRGMGNVTAGRVGATRVAVQGSGVVEIRSVDGPALNISVQGSGAVTARSGHVDSLDATIQGSGNATFGGTARRANLSVMGSGNIRVNEVTESVNDRTMGSGHISVHCPPRRSPDSFWN